MHGFGLFTGPSAYANQNAPVRSSVSYPSGPQHFWCRSIGDVAGLMFRSAQMGFATPTAHNVMCGF